MHSRVGHVQDVDALPALPEANEGVADTHSDLPKGPLLVREWPAAPEASPVGGQEADLTTFGADGVDPTELQRKLQDLVPEHVATEESPKELRFSHVEQVVEPEGSDFPSAPAAVLAAAVAAAAQEQNSGEERIEDVPNGVPKRISLGRVEHEAGRRHATEPPTPTVSVVDMDDEVSRHIDNFFGDEEDVF
eukprot:g22425.t1